MKIAIGLLIIVILICLWKADVPRMVERLVEKLYPLPPFPQIEMMTKVCEEKGFDVAIIVSDDYFTCASFLNPPSPTSTIQLKDEPNHP